MGGAFQGGGILANSYDLARDEVKGAEAAAPG